MNDKIKKIKESLAFNLCYMDMGSRNWTVADEIENLIREIIKDEMGVKQTHFVAGDGKADASFGKEGF